MFDEINCPLRPDYLRLFFNAIVFVVSRDYFDFLWHTNSPLDVDRQENLNHSITAVTNLNKRSFYIFSSFIIRLPKMTLNIAEENEKIKQQFLIIAWR